MIRPKIQFKDLQFRRVGEGVVQSTGQRTRSNHGHLVSWTPSKRRSATHSVQLSCHEKKKSCTRKRKKEIGNSLHLNFCYKCVCVCVNQ